MTETGRLAANFLGLPAGAAAYDAARLLVLPIPFEATVTYGRGTAAGPAAILAASGQVETWQPDLGLDLGAAPIHTHAPVPPVKPTAMPGRIEQTAAPLAADGKWVLALGGEHSITLGLVRAAAAAKAQGRPLSVLVVDAHLDLRAEWDGTPYSHACVMRRVAEAGHRTVHVGVRNACREEVEFARAEGRPIFWSRQCAAGEDWIAAVADALEGPVYVSIDCDGLDPSVVRTVGTPEPGGLSWWQTEALLEQVFARHEVVGADVVELAPAGDRASDFAAARLASRLAALALAQD